MAKRKDGFGEWGHFQGIGAGLALICGGPLAFFYPLWFMGPYGIGLGVIVTALEWPLGPVPNILGGAYNKYIVRGLLYILLSLPCFLQAAILNGGMFLLSTGLTYTYAHIRGEQIKPKGKRRAAAPRAQGEKR